MARLATNRIAWTYTSDAGDDYRVNAHKAVTDQTKLGGSAAAASVPPLPTGYQMRRITLRNATIGRSRTVPVYSSDAAILVPAATVNLNSSGLIADVWTEDSYAFTNNQSSPVALIGEKRPRKDPTTTQSA
jgi:hypothetical protein